MTLPERLSLRRRWSRILTPRLLAVESRRRRDRTACATYEEFRGEMTVRLDPDSERGMRVLVPPIARSAISPARHRQASGRQPSEREGGNTVTLPPIL